MLHACTAIAYASKLDTANLPVPTAKILPAFQFNRCHLHKLYFTSDSIVILTTRKTQWRSSSASDPSTESNAARCNTVPLLTSMQNAHTTRSQVHWSIDNSTKHQLVKRASVPCHCERQHGAGRHLPTQQPVKTVALCSSMSLALVSCLGRLSLSTFAFQSRTKTINSVAMNLLNICGAICKLAPHRCFDMPSLHNTFGLVFFFYSTHCHSP